MTSQKSRFALFFGNRETFPSSLIAEARQELPRVLKGLGHSVLMLDAQATRCGAVATAREGELFANFLHESRGNYDGIILCLPNFGDETGAVSALKEAGVPILIQAYPDDIHKMAPELRRDSFCGKLSIINVFCQYGVKFTTLKPHVVEPSSDRFIENISYFDKVCRVVKGMKGMVVGSIGARTTPFKTVRFDEIALQRYGITVEALDLADVIARVASLSSEDPKIKEKTHVLEDYTCWEGVPRQAFNTLVRLGVVLDDIIEEYRMDAIAIRCWIELQSQLGVSPCVLLGELNDRGVAAACEVDVGNAVAMNALALASESPATCLDWNNNYGEEDNKCILFHCGPAPNYMMEAGGKVTDHGILAQTYGKGYGYGCKVGRIKAGPVTFGSLVTDSGEVRAYLGAGKFTDDPIPDDFFGCAGVIEIDWLQDLLRYIGGGGFHHHLSVTSGLVKEPLREALEKYLGISVVYPQESFERAKWR